MNEHHFSGHREIPKFVDESMDVLAKKKVNNPHKQQSTKQHLWNINPVKDLKTIIYTRFKIKRQNSWLKINTK